MGKSLKGKELGKGIVQRKDEKYKSVLAFIMFINDIFTLNRIQIEYNIDNKLCLRG